MSDKYEIKVNNAFTNAWMDFSTEYAKNVFTYALTHLQQMPIKESYSKEDHIIEFDCGEIFDYTSAEVNRTDRYGKAVTSLVGNVIKFIDPKTKNLKITTLISGAEFVNGTSKIRLEIPQMVLPFIVAGTKQYTILDLQIILALRGKYSKRLYELLSQYRSTGEATFGILDLRGKMGTIDVKSGKIKEYPEWSDFRKRCVDDAVDEINEKYSDMEVSYKTHRRGRPVVAISFFFNFKPHQTTIPFELIAREDPNSDTAKYLDAIKHFGITAAWQIDFILKYRKNDLFKAVTKMRQDNQQQANDRPKSCARWLATLLNCLSSEDIDKWKSDNGLE
jgi:plasmid replication initiation protein